MGDWLKTGFKRFGIAPPAGIDPELGQSPPRGLDAESQALLEEGLPRGLPFGRERQNRSERAQWAGLEEIAELKWKPGDIVLGKFNGERLGFMDDKPMVTVASARSGKSSTVIIPTLLTYPGSALVLDPKGELAAETAEFRRDVLRQDVHVLDPFRCSGLKSASFNALAELDPGSPHLVDDVDKITQALILREGKDAEADHWTEFGAVSPAGPYPLCAASAEEGSASGQRAGPSDPHLPAAEDGGGGGRPHGGQGTRAGSSARRRSRSASCSNPWRKRATSSSARLAAAGQSFLRKYERERSSIMSTAETQTRFLDSPLLREVSGRSDFRLSGLREKQMTLYLCMSVGEMQSHFRWLRLIVRQALTVLERRGIYPRGKLPDAVPDGRIRKPWAHADHGAGGGIFSRVRSQALDRPAGPGAAEAPLRGKLADHGRQCGARAVLRHDAIRSRMIIFRRASA